MVSLFAQATSPTMHTIGTLSSKASPMPLSELVRPGPGTMQITPGLPVLREAVGHHAAENSCVTRR